MSILHNVERWNELDVHEIFCMQALWWRAACSSQQFHTCGNQMVNLFRVRTIQSQTEPSDFINRYYEIL